MTLEHIKLHVRLYAEIDKNQTAKYYADIVQTVLSDRVAVLRPVVTLATPPVEPTKYDDYAIRISPDTMEFVADRNNGTRTRSNWMGSYFVFSDDPEKMNLILPAHIFQRSFRFIEPEVDGIPNLVEEIW